MYLKSLLTAAVAATSFAIGGYATAGGEAKVNASVNNTGTATVTGSVRTGNFTMQGQVVVPSNGGQPQSSAGATWGTTWK